MNKLTCIIPSISCGHCKMTIEREVSGIQGVTSVEVAVGTKQAIIEFESPVIEDQISSVLVEIGFGPEE